MLIDDYFVADKPFIKLGWHCDKCGSPFKQGETVTHLTNEGLQMYICEGCMTEKISKLTVKELLDVANISETYPPDWMQ